MLQFDIEELIDGPVVPLPFGWEAVDDLPSLCRCTLVDDGAEPAIEHPALVMRHPEDPYHMAWVACTRFDSRGHRRHEAGYRADQPYMHPYVAIENSEAGADDAGTR